MEQIKHTSEEEIIRMLHEKEIPDKLCNILYNYIENSDMLPQIKLISSHLILPLYPPCTHIETIRLLFDIIFLKRTADADIDLLELRLLGVCDYNIMNTERMHIEIKYLRKYICQEGKLR